MCTRKSVNNDIKDLYGDR